MIGLSGMQMKLLPMFIWVTVGDNALEAVLVFHHNVNGKLNLTLGVSKVLSVIANSVFILAGVSHYNVETDETLAAIFCTSGVLYALHGMTLCWGCWRSSTLTN